MAERGLTQASLAGIVGVAQASVWAWLNGAIPQRRTATTLCEKLGVSQEWLLYGEGPARLGGVDGVVKIQLGIVKPAVMDAWRAVRRQSIPW